MQVPTLLLAVAIEIYIVLLIALVGLIVYSTKQKNLVRRQQDKLRELIDAIKTNKTPLTAPAKSYKQMINEQLALTEDRFALIAPQAAISSEQSPELPFDHRIVSLRYAFLRAEELGTTEVSGSEGYWNIFQQTLAPLLTPGPDLSSNHDLLIEPSNSEELAMYKKRVENLEKFKRLFFDLEKRWNEAQANAQGYYNELYAMSDEVADKERYELLLGQYGDTYKDMNHYIHDTNAAMTGGRPIENKTINIIRQDPRAAEEIMKLRNVAADQYRIISNLQRKLEEANTAEEKDLIIKELEQQLQRQVRFVQESDTCVQLLEEELNKAHEQIAKQEEIIEHEHHLEEENQLIKETLQHFTQESKELLSNMHDLERENDQLKSDLEHTGVEAGASPANLQEIQTEFAELQKQYAELEEKYLELKFK